jgi:NitT/TauT family transport system ATP-binding protein
VPPILSVEGVSIAYPAPQKPGAFLTVLEDISFEVAENELVTIIGPSGCGKSTLLRIISGLVAASAGRIAVKGEVIRGLNRHCAMVFQQIGLVPWRTVARNVEFALELKHHRRLGAAEHARVAEVIRLVGLAGFEKYYPYQISGGMQQRVGLARALVTEPDLLLMDEPFGALDAQTRNLLQDELLRLRQRRPTTILFVTHDLDEAAYVADRVVVLSARPGRIREIIRIDLPPNRPEYDVRAEPAYLEVRRKTWDLLKHENQPEEPLPLS